MTLFITSSSSKHFPQYPLLGPLHLYCPHHFILIPWYFFSFQISKGKEIRLSPSYSSLFYSSTLLNRTHSVPQLYITAIGWLPSNLHFQPDLFKDIHISRREFKIHIFNCQFIAWQFFLNFLFLFSKSISPKSRGTSSVLFIALLPEPRTVTVSHFSNIYHYQNPLPTLIPNLTNVLSSDMMCIFSPVCNCSYHYTMTYVPIILLRGNQLTNLNCHSLSHYFELLLDFSIAFDPVDTSLHFEMLPLISVASQSSFSLCLSWLFFPNLFSTFSPVHQLNVTFQQGFLIDSLCFPPLL